MPDKNRVEHPAMHELLEFAAKIARREYLPSLEKCRTIRDARAEVAKYDSYHCSLAMKLKEIWDRLNTHAPTPAPEPTAPNDEEFEDWMQSRGHLLNFDKVDCYPPVYEHPDTQYAWEIWVSAIDAANRSVSPAAPSAPPTVPCPTLDVEDKILDMLDELTPDDADNSHPAAIAYQKAAKIFDDAALPASPVSGKEGK